MTRPDVLDGETETASSLTKRSRQWGAALALIAVAGGAGAVGGRLFDRSSHIDRDTPGLSREQVIEIAQRATIAQRNAALAASDYSRGLSEGITTKKPVFMSVLNGRIKTVTPPGVFKGGPPQTYKDPIFLSQETPSQQPDKDGKFLVGCWIGIKSSDMKGNIVIMPIPYANDGSMHFEPNDPNRPLLAASVWASEVSQDPNVTGYTLYGYDPNGNEPYKNDDGSAFTPGETEQE